MIRPLRKLRWTPLAGLSLIALGGLVYAYPTQSRQFAMQASTRISTSAIDCWRAAGWNQISQMPATATRGYRAPQRFAKPSKEVLEIQARGDRAILPASHDEASNTETSQLEIAQDQSASQRPQVTAPLLAAPGNAPQLRQLGGGTAPKLRPSLPSPPKVGEAPPNASPSALNAPGARKIRNPYAMKTSDDGQAKSQNEQALLEDEKKFESSPAPLPMAMAEEEKPVGSGIALENLARKHSQEANSDQAKPEISVLKRRPEPNSAHNVSPSSDAYPKNDGAAAAPRRPFTAILLDAAPGAARKDDPGAESSPNLSSALEPALLKPNELLDHHASNFHGVTPGDSDEKAAIEALGAPLSVVADGEQRILRFKSDAFKAIEVCVIRGRVDSLTLVMHKPLPTKDIVKELGLAPFEPALVTNPDGYVLGQVYPERGVILEFAPAETGAAEVDQIVLDRVKAEPFLIRALDDKSHRYLSAFRDLEIALQLDPQEARALWLRANLLLELGRPIGALRAVEDAIRIDSLAPGNHLTRAKILLALGRHSESARIVASILAQNELPPQAKARALCQQAELLASGADPNFEQGLESFRSAISEASKLAEDTRPSVRRLARRVLIEAHLGVSRCIAWGRLEDADKASTQWHERARLLAETAIGDEDLGEDIWLAIHRSAMEVHLGLMAKSNPDRQITELQIDHKRLTRAAADRLYQQRVKWELAVAFTDASRIESARGKSQSAEQLADAAWSLMSEGIRGREANEQDDFARGMLLYQLGSIAAVARQDSAKALGWYAQAIPFLEKPLPESIGSQNGLRGLALVGMGASYWEAGDQQQALSLADRGAKTLQEASKTGHASREALSLAWGNLESMYRETGDTPAADRVARMAAGGENSTILR